MSSDAIFWPLLSGARAAFLGGAIEDVGIRRVVERLAEERATVTDFVPSVFNVLVGYLREAPERYEALRSLRHVLVGGERMSPAAVAELKRNLPHVGITNTYGATEASIGSVFHELSQRVDEEEDIPIGRPIDNTTAYVVDRHGELAPVGAIGEIQLGGACVGAGYLGSEDATRRSFVDGRYRTGDRGRWAADGTLEFLGRADDQVKVRGVRVGLAHVAAAVARHPDVADAYVAPLADGLVAYVVLRDRRALDEPAMRDHLRRVLPRRLVPDRLVAVEALPLTSAGKVDRSRLPAAVPRERTATAPRTDTEARVQRVWEDVLGHGPIGVDEDFFEVGGHSLAALRLHAALERDLDVELPLSLLVGGGTIETVAAAVEAARDRQAASPIVELGGSGSPSIVFVHPSSGLLEPYLSLARRLRTRHACYGVRAAVRGCGDVDLGELARAHADAIVAAGLGGSILVGWSIGGLLALEIARCGVGAPLVVLLDTRPPAAGARRADPLSELFGEGRAGDYGGEQLASILEVHELLVAAARRYAHSPPDVPVVLVRAGDGELGWGEAASGWRVETTPGDHHSMLREPHVAALADLLLDAIAEAGLAAAAAS